MEQIGGLLDDATKQPDPLEAKTHWFHVFRTMIDSGEFAKMEGSTVKVYLVIKAHANFTSGSAFPALATIAEKAGVSISIVQRSIRSLEAMGYVGKTKVGRANAYTLREKVEIRDSNGTPTAEATWDYLPSGVNAAIADLKNVLVTGDLAGAKIVMIERLQVQVIQGEHATGMQVQEADLVRLADKNPALFERIVAMRNASKTRPT